MYVNLILSNSEINRGSQIIENNTSQIEKRYAKRVHYLARGKSSA